VRFDENGTVFQDRIRLLQYRRQSSGEKRKEQHCTLCSPMKLTSCSINFSVGIDRLRFGYVDRTSEFVLTYEENESGHSVFPGKQLCTS